MDFPESLLKIGLKYTAFNSRNVGSFYVPFSTN